MNSLYAGLKSRAGRMPAALALTLATTVGGCASFSTDGGMTLVTNIASVELGKDARALRTEGDATEAHAAVEKLARRVLTADAAVQIALLNNRGLQAAYNELGLAETIRVQASIPPNPTFTIEHLSGRVEIEIEKRIIANILSLLTLPARAEVAADRFRQAQLRAVEETLRVAQEARRAFYHAVHARELASLLARSQSAAESATAITRRLGESGAVNKLDQAREQAFYAEVTAQLGTARQHASTERERLARVMGFWGRNLDFKLPAALPPLPARPHSLPAIEMEAVGRRVDLQIARIELDAVSKNLGLTQATRFINLLEVSGISQIRIERGTGERERTHGFEFEFQIPIFDGGEVRARQASETYMHAVNRLVDRAIAIRSEAREAYRTYRSTYDIAAHYRREILPLRKIISDETLLRYNAMQIDVFALLSETRQKIAVTIAAIEAQREFWLAKTNLLSAIVGGGAAGDVSDEVARAPGTMANAGGH